MNVQQVIDSVIAYSDVPVRLQESCDKLMSGSPSMEVKGIVTSFMATVDVIKGAISSGANMIITHEPTYFTGADDTGWLEKDPVYLEKQKLIDENNIAIWRYHDHMHMKNGDAIYEGLIKEIGWEDYLIEGNEHPHVYEIPETTLRELAVFFKEKFSMDVVQLVGKSEMKCSRIGILVGGGSLGLGSEQMPMELMNQKKLDVIICGEITEWTLCAYVNDAQMMGFNKAMLVLGHERTEEWGMKYMAEWLPNIVEDIPVTFIDAKEPFRYLY